MQWRQVDRVVLDYNNSPFLSTCPWHSEQWTVMMLPCKHSGLQPWDGQQWYTSSGTAPRVSTLCLCDVTALGKISQVFPLHICNQRLEVRKSWGRGYKSGGKWQQLGMETRSSTAVSVQPDSQFLCQLCVYFCVSIVWNPCIACVLCYSQSREDLFVSLPTSDAYNYVPWEFQLHDVISVDVLGR